MNRIENKVTSRDWQSLTLGLPYRRYGVTDERGPGAGATAGQYRGGVAETRPGRRAGMHGEADSSDDAKERLQHVLAGRCRCSQLKGEVVSRDDARARRLYGPETKDLIDIFTPDKGVGNRTVLIYVAGGAGNKLEQQSVEANAFYDNIGRWAAENGMVGVNMQRVGVLETRARTSRS